MTKDRLMIFIDGQNLMCGASTLGIRVDIDKLAAFLSEGRSLEGKYYYNSIPSNPDDNPEMKRKIDGQMGFYRKLEYLGFKTSIIPLRKRIFSFKCRDCGHTTTIETTAEKGVDIALASDMLSLAFDGAYDVAVIVSGDLDYHKAIEEVQRRGLIVEVAYFKGCGISMDLIKLADRFIDLEDFVDKIRFTQRE